MKLKLLLFSSCALLFSTVLSSAQQEREARFWLTTPARTEYRGLPETDEQEIRISRTALGDAKRVLLGVLSLLAVWIILPFGGWQMYVYTLVCFALFMAFLNRRELPGRISTAVRNWRATPKSRWPWPSFARRWSKATEAPNELVLTKCYSYPYAHVRAKLARTHTPTLRSEE